MHTSTNQIVMLVNMVSEASHGSLMHNVNLNKKKKKNHTLFGNHLPEYEVLKLSNLTKRRKKNVERFDR